MQLAAEEAAEEVPLEEKATAEKARVVDETIKELARREERLKRREEQLAAEAVALAALANQLHASAVRMQLLCSPGHLD